MKKKRNHKIIKRCECDLFRCKLKPVCRRMTLCKRLSWKATSMKFSGWLTLKLDDDYSYKFRLINVSGRSTYSSVHCWRQSGSCRNRLSVEQSSIACCPLSPSSAVVLNHISFHFLIPLSDSPLICRPTVPAQWVVILDTIRYYIQHFFNISGYEVSRQHDVTAHNDGAAGSAWRSSSHVGQSSAARRPESLATRREAVELLSCDASLLSYLVQNGAVSRLDAELIERETASSARQNIALLRCVDRAGRAGLALLLNALRLTGQHQLANLLDYTPRILPLPPAVESTSSTPGDWLG